MPLSLAPGRRGQVQGWDPDPREGPEEGHGGHRRRCGNRGQVGCDPD